jgi:hypothetical protein
MRWCNSLPFQTPLRFFALFAICVLVAAAVQPAIAQSADNPRISVSAPEPTQISPAAATVLTALAQMRATANQRDSGLALDELIAAAEAANETADRDGDGLYDSVEWVLGTDDNNTDPILTA